MWNWNKINETGDFKYLVKSGIVDSNKEKAYENLQKQIIDLFGISEKYKKILRLRVKIEEMYNKVYTKNERYLIAQIQPLERELEALEKQDIKSDIFDSFIAIEKQMGFKLDYKLISIREFYNYGTFIEKVNKAVENNSKNI